MSLENKTDQMGQHQPQNIQLASRQEWQGAVSRYNGIGEEVLSNIIAPLTIETAQAQEPELATQAALTLVYEALTGEDDPRLIELEQKGNRKLSEQDDEAASDEDNSVIKRKHDGEISSMVLSTPWVKDIIGERNFEIEHESLRSIWPAFVEIYLDGLQNAIDSGYIPEDRKEAFKMASKRTAYRIADPVVLGAATPGAAAYYHAGLDQIVIGIGPLRGGNLLIQPISHETTHQISGGTFVHDSTSDTLFNRPRLGFSSETIHDPNEAKERLINEWLTEHATQGILNGDFETFDPDKRQDDDMMYYGIRKVGAAFVDLTDGIIDKKVLIRSLFEDSGPAGSSQDRRLVLRQFQAAWGKGARRKLETLFELTSQISDFKWGDETLKEKVEELVISRLVAPIKDAEGNVVETGQIDLSNMPGFNNLLAMSREAEQAKQERISQIEYI